MREMGADWARPPQNRVTLRVYPGGVAGDEPDLVRKMRIGQLQAAAMTTAGLADIDPAFNVFNIPMFFASYPELYATLDKLEPVLSSGSMPRASCCSSGATAAGCTSSPRARVATVDGLRKTQDVRVGGRRPDGGTVEVARASSPVPLAATDIMTGLQTGMIDSVPDDAAARAHAAVVPPDAEHGGHGHGAAGRRAGDDASPRGRRSRPRTGQRSSPRATAGATARGRGAAPGHHGGGRDAEARPQGEPGGGRERRAVPRDRRAVRRAA